MSVFIGPTIITRYLGATDHKCSRIVATCKRDRETTWRAVVPYDDCSDDCKFPGDRERSAHWRAVEKLLTRFVTRFDGPMVPVACGHDQDAYYWVVVTEHQAKAGGYL